MKGAWTIVALAASVAMLAGATARASWRASDERPAEAALRPLALPDPWGLECGPAVEENAGLTLADAAAAWLGGAGDADDDRPWPDRVSERLLDAWVAASVAGDDRCVGLWVGRPGGGVRLVDAGDGWDASVPVWPVAPREGPGQEPSGWVQRGVSAYGSSVWVGSGRVPGDGGARPAAARRPVAGAVRPARVGLRHGRADRPGIRRGAPDL